MGGLGKSMLATALVHADVLRMAFRDGVHWVTLGQSPNLALLQQRLCKERHVADFDFIGVREGKERLRQVFAGMPICSALSRLPPPFWLVRSKLLCPF